MSEKFAWVFAASTIIGLILFIAGIGNKSTGTWITGSVLFVIGAIGLAPMGKVYRYQSPYDLGEN